VTATFDEPKTRSDRKSASMTDAAPLDRRSPSAPPYSFARFKAFLAQRAGAALSEQDAEKLYAEFLDWNRRAAN